MWRELVPRLASGVWLAATLILNGCGSSSPQQTCADGQVLVAAHGSWQCATLPTAIPGPTGAMGSVGASGAPGPTGPGLIGPTGPTGTPGLSWLGAWSPETSYVAGDVVSQGGASYVALQPTQGGSGPPGDTGDWALVAEAGLLGPTGGVGPQGATGPTGATGLEWRGAWSVNASYAVGDAVSQGGSSYVALQPVSGGTGPATDSTDWALLAQAGVAGLAGATGSTGAVGAPGATGAPGLTWTGSWSVETTYALGDVVSLGGASYVAVQPNAGSGAPPGNTADWALVAEAGLTGATGTVGVTGPTGELGPTGLPGLAWQGTWGDSTSYVAGDVVFEAGASYVALQPTIGGSGPALDPTDWAVMTAAGTTGSTGITGSTGPMGPTGAESWSQIVATIPDGGITNAMLANADITVVAQAPLLGGGSVALGGSITVGLLAPGATGNVLSSKGGAWQSLSLPSIGAATVTTGALQLYVRTDGSDTACNGTANASASAAPNCGFATAQAAMNSVPTFVMNAVAIQIDAGTYYQNGTTNILTISRAGQPDTGSISITGSGTVILSGATAASPTTPVAHDGVLVSTTALPVTLSNFTVEEVTAEGVHVDRATATLSGITAQNAGNNGVLCERSASCMVSGTVTGQNNVAAGFAVVTGAYVTDNGSVNVSANSNGGVVLSLGAVWAGTGSVTGQNNGYSEIAVNDGSTMWLAEATLTGAATGLNINNSSSVSITGLRDPRARILHNERSIYSV